jgi:hypothetical protein
MPTPPQLIGARVVLLLAIGGLSCSPPSRQRAIVPSVAVPLPQRVELERGGWRLVADLQRPVSLAQKAVPAVLLLNKAAGSRTAYTGLPAALAQRGVASLRLDLSAHAARESGRPRHGPADGTANAQSAARRLARVGIDAAVRTHG